MVGNGELDVALREKYANIPGIHFIDFQNQQLMPAVYEIADVFVLPSRGPGETWGLSVNEAMANGNAVIVSDKCGCAEDLIKNGINGYIFKAGDVDNLIKVLKNMNEHRDAISIMKQESKRIIGGFTFEKVAETIERVVNK
jgi:glycosyltransferase involved in cell wall biosynthesis